MSKIAINLLQRAIYLLCNRDDPIKGDQYSYPQIELACKWLIKEAKSSTPFRKSSGPVKVVIEQLVDIPECAT